MKRSNKKLEFKKEAIRILSAQELEGVAGAHPTTVAQTPYCLTSSIDLASAKDPANC